MSEAPEAIAEPVERIRAAVENWGDAGCEGTYVADAVDYGKIDIAVLRDSRTLLAALEAKDGELARLRAVEKAARRLEQMGPAHRLDPVPDDIKATIRASNAHESHTPRSENCWHCQGGWDTPIEPGGTTTWADRYHEQGDAWPVHLQGLSREDV